MSKFKMFKIKVAGLVVFLGLFGCFHCASATEIKANKNDNIATSANNVANVNNAASKQRIEKILKGGISYKGNGGKKNARDLSEKEVVQVATFMYALARNYVREFGFKEDKARGFIEEFLKSFASDLSRDGFDLEIKDLVSSKVTEEQLKAIEKMNATKNLDRIKVTMSDFKKVKVEILKIARNCVNNTKKDARKVYKIMKKGGNSILEYMKDEISEEIKNYKKQGLTEASDKVKKLNKLLKDKKIFKGKRKIKNK